MRVLIVDDHERDLRTVEHTVKLFGRGAEVVGAVTSGDEALAIAAETEFDVAIVDYRMPGMNGLQVAERLKQLRPACKVVILTAFDEARQEVDASPDVDHFHEKMRLETIGAALDALARGIPPRDEAPLAKRRGLFRRRA